MNDILFGNNNQKMINKLAKRSFFKNRGRNIAAVLAIALTSFLFTSVITLGFGATESLSLTQQMLKGSKSDGDIRYMTQEQFERLEENDSVEQAGLRRFIGFMSNANQHNIEIDYADSVQQELTFCTPTHGRAPQASNEVTTTELALKDLGIEPEVGAKVPVEFQLRGQTYYFDMVLSGWWEAANEQTSLMIVSEAFMQDNQAVFYNSYAEDREIAGTYLSDVILASKSDIQDQLMELARSIGGNPDDQQADNYMLCAKNQVSNASLQSSTIAAIICFAGLFMVCGYLLIYNIFDISVMEDVRQYGLLRTVGTSTKQIKRIVNRQALWLAMIGLPIGLILGYFVGKACVPVIIHFFSYNTKTIAQTSPAPSIFIIAACFTMITVWISVRKPMKKASKVSPMEGIRYTEQRNYKKFGKHGHGGTKLSQMAFHNLGRNKRRTGFIIISMLLCMVLFNSALIITQSIDEDKWTSRNTKTDFTLYNSNIPNMTTGFTSHEDALNADMVDVICQQAGVTDGRYLYKNTMEDMNVTVDYGFKHATINGSDQVNGRTYKAYDNGGRMAVSDRDNRLYGNVYGMSDAFLDDLDIYSGETDKNALKQKMRRGNYLVLGTSMNKLTGEPADYPFYENLQADDSISFYKEGSLYKTYTIAACATVVMLETETLSGTNGAAKVGGDAPYLYLTDSDFKELYDVPTLLSYGFNVQDKYKPQTISFLEEMSASGGNTAYTSTQLMLEQLEDQRHIILLVGGMIGIILALAGLINFTNTMITNIIARRNEFAVMLSIGMTNKQLRKLVIWEGAYYAIFAGLVGIILTTLFSANILRAVLNSPSMWYFTFQFTLLPALIICIIYLILAVIVPVVALKCFNKGSIVEHLRVA